MSRALERALWHTTQGLCRAILEIDDAVLDELQRARIRDLLLYFDRSVTELALNLAPPEPADWKTVEAQAEREREDAVRRHRHVA